MGIMDFDSVFELIDLAKQRYITVKQVNEFDNALHFTPLCDSQYDAAVRQICGKDVTTVSRSHFSKLIPELQRRRKLEEQLQWDFQALDKTGSHTITIENALMLFQVAHGSKFSILYWKKFLNTRKDPSGDVCFDDVRLWLCNDPDRDTASDKEVTYETSRLNQLKEQNKLHSFTSYQTEKLEDPNNLRDQRDYEETTRRLSRRKLNRWERDGLEALLFDDGIDHGEDVPLLSRRDISISDVINALVYKYDLLRRSLLWAWVQALHGQANWALMTPEERRDAFEEMKEKEENLRKENNLNSGVTTLSGSQLTLELSLGALMGFVNGQQVDLVERRKKLQADGKNQSDVDETLRHEFQTEMNAQGTLAQLLLDLNKRFDTERESLVSRIRSYKGKQRLLSEYAHLIYQHLLSEKESTLTCSLLVVGLAERDQEYKPSRFDQDRFRQEHLAQMRWKARREGGDPIDATDPTGTKVKGQGLHDLQVDVLREVNWKHIAEREIFMELLGGSKASTEKNKGLQQSPATRQSKLVSLRNQRNAWREDATSSQRDIHIKILQEAMGLHFAGELTDMKERGASTEEDDVDASILADLQQMQHQEVQCLLKNMVAKDEKALLVLKSQHISARMDEDWDNVAAIILGTFTWTEEEKPLVKLLEQKYDILRQTLLCHVLKLEYGAAWERLGSHEREKLYIKKKVEEQKLREEGKLSDLAGLLNLLPKDMESLRALMGEDRHEYFRRLALHDGNPDEVTVDPSKNINLLADLMSRHKAEQDAVIGLLRSCDNPLLTGERAKLLPYAWLRVEIRRVTVEQWFDVAALSVGLFERVHAAKSNRHRSDRERQEKLARLRVTERRKRVDTGLQYHKAKDDYAWPEKGDMAAWMEAFLREMDKKQRDERETLLAVLQDPGLEDLREVAKTMTPHDRLERLAELKVKWGHLDFQDPGNREENISILEEAAALRSVQVLEGLKGEDISLEEVSTSLLAELQDEQDREMALKDIASWNEEELKINREHEIDARHSEMSENVLRILTKYEGSTKDDLLLQALDDKYDTLKDKLLLELLMRQAGEAEWLRLSEKERQRRLMQLKLQEKQWRKEGRFDELERLLGESLKNELSLAEMMGMNRAEYEKRLRERLQRRQKSGHDDDEDIDEVSESGKGKILDDLQNRWEAERDALMAKLRGVDNNHMSERERQLELIRLRREKRKMDEMNTFHSAAALLGLAERQQDQLVQRLKQDRERHLALARRRLEQLKNKTLGQGLKRAGGDDVIRSQDVTVMQDAVMALLDDKHEDERHVMAAMLAVAPHKDVDAMLGQSLEYELEEQREGLLGQRRALAPEQVRANHEVLQEAVHYKKESRRRTLGAGEGLGGAAEGGMGVVPVSLMADLQEVQDLEAEQTLQAMTDKEEDGLVQLQLKMLFERKNQRVENMAAVVFGAEDAGKGDVTRDVIGALEGKYDALRDKLLIQALMNQVGDAEWQRLSEEERQRLSEEERQRRLVAIRLQERQLRREGKMDQVNALLGEALQNHQLLESLLGSQKEDYEERLKERLRRRKERLAQGMSEEECDEMEAIEERELSKKRNILQDLEHNFEQEKAAILKRLEEADDKLTREKRRQQELARLRREKLRAHQEDKLEGAALAICLGQQQEQTLVDQRRKQEQLARERLQTRLLARRAASVTSSGEGDQPFIKADSSRSVLQEAVFRQLEMQFMAEREALIALLRDPRVSEERAARADFSDEERECHVKELHTSWHKWRASMETIGQDQRDLLLEALVLQLETRKATSTGQGKDVSDDDLQVALLADLQEIQEAEAKKLLDGVDEKSPETLHQFYLAQSLAMKNGWHDNMAQILLATRTSLGSAAQEKDLLLALEEKYDCLRDKLLAQALVEQLGEDEWRRLSERERQAKLMELRLRERKLRGEGNYDEAAGLLGQLIEREQELHQQLGRSRSEQKREMEARRRRKKELLKKRQAQGLSTTDAVLEDILQTEEQQVKVTRKNILAELQGHYEDEKDALLKSLRDQKSRLTSERARQLELAKLRRQTRQLEREDKFDSAAILLQLAERQDQSLRESLRDEQLRQKELARLRLQEKKNRLNQARLTENQAAELQKQLREEDAKEKVKNAVDAANVEKYGAAALQAAILEDVDRRHDVERDLLMALLELAPGDVAGREMIKTLSVQELKVELERLRQDRGKWRGRSRALAYRLAEAEAGVSQEEVEQHRVEVARGRAEQFALLTTAMALRIKVESATKVVAPSDGKEDNVNDDISVTLLADLQDKQNAELRAVEKILLEQDDSVLSQVKESQRRSIREGWFDNVTHTVFSLGAEGVSGQDEGDDTTVTLQQAEEDLDKQLEMQKSQLREQAQHRPDMDLDAEMARLEAEQQTRRKCLEADVERQRGLARQKLAAKRRARESREYEQDSALQLIRMAERQSSFVLEKAKEEKDRQLDLMQQRLLERREARLLAAESEKTARGDEQGRRGSNRRISANLLPEELRMSRERSVIDVALTEDQKNEVYQQLIRQQTALNKKMESDHKRHEDQLKKRVEDMKGRRSAEAHEVLRMADRQKTTLEKARQDEQQRQLDATRERVSRIRYERTMTMKEGGSRSTRRFDDFVSDQQRAPGDAGGDTDAEMEKMAKRMQEKFEAEAKRAKSVERGTKPVTNEEKMKLLKQKREAKKRERKENSLQTN